ncbi:glutathione/cysteine ABC transporter permease/ATP-binding protein, partial [Pseudonocardiaceae bacterium YIM PH 21723]
MHPPGSPLVTAAPTRATSKGPLGELPRLSAAARWALVLYGLLALLTAGAVIAQAVGIAGAITGKPGYLWIALAGVAGRGVLAWAGEVVAVRAAARVKEQLRERLLRAMIRLGPEWIGGRGAAQAARLATGDLDTVDGYFTRFLPALVAAAIVPPVVGLWILCTDLTSAALIAVTVPLIPLFAALVGRFTRDRVEQAAAETARLSGHLLELLRALPVLTAFRRAAAQSESVRRVSRRHEQVVGGTLRVAFLSALVLELVATMSLALVAVGIGLRLAGGELTLFTGLAVLLLAPECYLPLRAAGAAFHASEDGLETIRRVASVVDTAPKSAMFGHAFRPNIAITQVPG